MSVYCDRCKRKVRAVMDSEDHKEWLCSDCYFGKDKEKKKELEKIER